MNEVIAAGLLLGASAGFAPGPLMTLVILQSLRHGTREGCKTALVPLVTDLPVVVLSLAFTASMQNLRPFLGLISLAGGLFVLRLAWQSFRPLKIDAGARDQAPKSWQKASSRISSAPIRGCSGSPWGRRRS